MLNVEMVLVHVPFGSFRKSLTGVEILALS